MYKLISPNGEVRELEDTNEEYVFFRDGKVILKLKEFDESRELQVLGAERTPGLISYEMEDENGGWVLSVDCTDHPAWVGTNVEGVWLHILNERIQDLDPMKFLGIEGEICVSSIEQGNFFTRRSVWVGVLFEGVSKELYDEDCYSYIGPTGLRHPSPTGQTGGHRAEGFLCPKESIAVAIVSNAPDSPEAGYVASLMGLPILAHWYEDGESLISSEAVEGWPSADQALLAMGLPDAGWVELPWSDELAREIKLSKLKGVKVEKVWPTQQVWHPKSRTWFSQSMFHLPAMARLQWDVKAPGVPELLWDLLPELWGE